ncbi:hypothetical protein CAMP5121_08075, partial [Campylobacter sp. 2352 PW]|uniref:hypothetical protein n=1 Tax=Campylobacter sp. 2352 PW TaxID=2735750 RepID=UPI00301D5951|nr:hypothetical protein [Campylobacter sp. 2352 PW]
MNAYHNQIQQIKIYFFYIFLIIHPSHTITHTYKTHSIFSLLSFFFSTPLPFLFFKNNFLSSTTSY